MVFFLKINVFPDPKEFAFMFLVNQCQSPLGVQVSYQKVQIPTINTWILTTLDSKDNKKIKNGFVCFFPLRHPRPPNLDDF